MLQHLTIIHSDGHVIVVDKPAGIAVHAGAGRAEGTLVDALLKRFPDLADINLDHGNVNNNSDLDRPGIVHRIDMDTSGLMVIGRSPEAVSDLSNQIRNRLVDRRYTALVRGMPYPAIGIIDAPIGRDSKDRTRQCVSANGRPARTKYRVLESFGEPDPSFSLLELKLETGRMHQIRVHMQSIGHPVVGDKTYGGGNALFGLNRQFLHAHRLTFKHPDSGEKVQFHSRLPSDLTNTLNALQS